LKKVAPIPCGRLVRGINHPRYVVRLVWVTYQYTVFQKAKLLQK